MQKIILSLQHAAGKKRYALAFVLGCLVSAAFAPVYFFPAAIVGFSGFLVQLRGCTTKNQAFWLGWWFGWGHFTAGLYWISFALLTDIAQFWWMFPFAMFGIPAVLAFYTALVSLCMYRIPRTGVQRVLLFAAAWTVAEMLRSVLFTGFPWNLTGYIWTFSDTMMQITSVIGIHGLGLLTVLAFAMPSVLCADEPPLPAKKSGTKFIPVLLAFLPLVLVAAWGGLRLSGASSEMTTHRIRLVQGNISQNQKWDESLRHEIVEKYLRMTKQDGFDAAQYVLWPESALPYFLDVGDPLMEAVAAVVPKNGAVITGSMHAEYSPYGFVTKVWNSLHVINARANIAGLYNKHHLVPFGEYVPFRAFLPIDKITPGQMDFSPGEGITTLVAEDVPPFSPLICYEAVFPGAVIDKKTPPEWMLNVTNDAWYGNSAGPYQHFAMVKVRAVEHGIPLVRVANTGISGIIDAYGRTVAKTKLGEDAVLDGNLPAIIRGGTLYTQVGDAVVWLMLLGLCGYGMLYNRDNSTSISMKMSDALSKKNRSIV